MRHGEARLTEFTSLSDQLCDCYRAGLVHLQPTNDAKLAIVAIGKVYHIKPYIFGALRWTYYKQSDVDRFAGPRPKETQEEDQ